MTKNTINWINVEIRMLKLKVNFVGPLDIAITILPISTLLRYARCMSCNKQCPILLINTRFTIIFEFHLNKFRLNLLHIFVSYNSYTSVKENKCSDTMFITMCHSKALLSWSCLIIGQNILWGYNFYKRHQLLVKQFRDNVTKTQALISNRSVLILHGVLDF